METVWVLHSESENLENLLRANNFAQIKYANSVNDLIKNVSKEERPIVLTTYEIAEKLSNREIRCLALQMLPPNLSSDRLLLAVRSVLAEAKLNFELEMAEKVPWGLSSSFLTEDESLETLGSCILDLAEARNFESIEQAIFKACLSLEKVKLVRVLPPEESTSFRDVENFQLAIPIHFSEELKAHIYVEFEEKPTQESLDRIGDLLFNLSDSIALSVDRNRIIVRAEETKAVWEASFDAVEDPVAILDGQFKIVRANRAYGTFSEKPLVRIRGLNPVYVDSDKLKSLPWGEPSEWNIQKESKHYRIFFDPIREPLGTGRYVLRYHDVSAEYTLTEKLLAREQIAEMGILISSVAHEINNPIGGIMALGQILLSDLSKDSFIRSDVENMYHAAERCKRIVQTMLSLVRAPDEKSEEIDLFLVIYSAIELLNSELKRYKIKMSLPDEEMRGSTIFFNKNRVLQVFIHLIQQAIASIKEDFEAGNKFLKLRIVKGYDLYEVFIEDNGDENKHRYEIKSSIAFTVTKMILDELRAEYQFIASRGLNQQKIIFPLH